ncbi:MAG: hypothetical protein KAU22_11615 [Desulfuromonadales bacterium]|nr:hypothetical protein [Desulfuromonadales bacterium]
MLKSAVFLFSFLILLQILLPCSAVAENLEISVEEQPEINEQDNCRATTELNVPGIGMVNVTHYYLSTSMERLSQRIDVFFGEDRIYEEATGTYVQARGKFIYGRGGELDFDGKFRIKLDLPQVKKKINLVIESDDGRDDSKDFNSITTGNNVVGELAEQNISTALQFMVKEKKRWRLSIRPGLKFSSQLESFIKLRFRRSKPLGETWLSRGTVEIAYFSENGWENEYRLELERDLGRGLFFRSTSTVLWREDFPGNQFLGQKFLVTHIFDPRQSIAFEVGSSARTQSKLRELSYFSSIRYRRNIHQGWLFFELKPQVIFSRENDYAADLALILSLEALFGAKHLN